MQPEIIDSVMPTELEDDTDDNVPPQSLGEGLDAFKQYVSMKAHFNSSYDWKKYRGQTTVTREIYEKRRDKKFFQILQSRFSSIERNQIYLANFVYDKHLWIGECLTEQCIGIWHEWKGRIQRMDYQFQEDLKNSLDEIQRRKQVDKVEALKRLIRKPDNTHPLVHRLIWGGMFGVESYLLLSKALGLKTVYSLYLSKDALWADFEFKIEKYGYFLSKKLDASRTRKTICKIGKE